MLSARLPLLVLLILPLLVPVLAALLLLPLPLGDLAQKCQSPCSWLGIKQAGRKMRSPFLSVLQVLL